MRWYHILGYREHTPYPIPHTQARSFAFRNGFGLLEVMFAAVVLGFLLVGLNLLQKGNREAVLRIRTRDAAQIVAQNFMDSISRLGISSVANVENKLDSVSHTWEGKHGEIEKFYKRNYTIKAVEDLNSVERSDYITSENNIDSVHISAKKVTLTVSWKFKNADLSISEERIIK